MNQLAVDLQLVAGLRVRAHTVDQCGEIAFENDGKIAANGIDLPDTEDFQAGTIDGLDLTIGTDGGHAFLGTAEVIGAGVKADQDVPAVGGFKEPLFKDRR